MTQSYFNVLPTSRKYQMCYALRLQVVLVYYYIGIISKFYLDIKQV